MWRTLPIIEPTPFRIRLWCIEWFTNYVIGTQNNLSQALLGYHVIVLILEVVVLTSSAPIVTETCRSKLISWICRNSRTHLWLSSAVNSQKYVCWVLLLPLDTVSTSWVPHFSHMKHVYFLHDPSLWVKMGIGVAAAAVLGFVVYK